MALKPPKKKKVAEPPPLPDVDKGKPGMAPPHWSLPVPLPRCACIEMGSSSHPSYDLKRTMPRPYPRNIKDMFGFGGFSNI